MMTISDYIKIILQKKKWTNVRFAEEINKINAKIGEKKIFAQNITNMLNDDRNISIKTLVKFEVALGLENGSLTRLAPNQPMGKEAKRVYKEIKEKVGIYGN